MPNVVDAQRPTFAGGATDTCCSSDFLKQRDHMWIRPSSASLCCKETGIIAQRQWKLPPPLNMDGQLPCEFWSDRHKPRLEKLCVANGENPLDDIDIAQCQIEGFANAEAASVQKNQQRSIHGRLQRSAVNVNHRCGLEQPAQLFQRIDIW